MRRAGYASVTPVIPLLFLLLACAEPGASPAAQGQAQVQAPSEASESAAPAPQQRPDLYDVTVVRRYPHDTNAFTQGLFFANGTLYESTGQKGASRIKRLNLKTGKAVAEAALPDEVFGEGATVVGDRIVSLTWRAGQGFVHDLETLKRTATFAIEGEGWGLTYDPDTDRLILSDGTPELRFLDPETYEETGRRAVSLGGRPVADLNELEWVDGEVWANVWQQDVIVRIDPETGIVTGLIDVQPLFPANRRAEPYDDVPNGIAYEPRTGRLFLTGKRWPDIFEVTLEPRS
ncbi:glutaminyl-peptide cyclotransferase [Parvularcula dongshanensis]|uniref:Glutamine cyclotransferase n=1 Tax=Parvularcula dongshanensis TaxID=1173995 RepID=A0A840I255_9PROT|nr:glutamine cyclotransferase [Parvularcula dongshanensis]